MLLVQSFLQQKCSLSPFPSPRTHLQKKQTHNDERIVLRVALHTTTTTGARRYLTPLDSLALSPFRLIYPTSNNKTKKRRHTIRSVCSEILPFLTNTLCYVLRCPQRGERDVVAQFGNFFLSCVLPLCRVRFSLYSLLGESNH
jgi:hypothetical protein